MHENISKSYAQLVDFYKKCNNEIPIKTILFEEQPIEKEDKDE